MTPRGEAFDKAARLLGLPYPGGPEIGRCAAIARDRHMLSPVSFPRPMLKDSSYNFSYSGLKTAMRVFLEKHPHPTENEKMALAMEFEDAIVETLLEKTKRAVEAFNPKTVVVGGGVSANLHLRKSITDLIDRYPGSALHLSDIQYATDNALMIALAAYTHRADTICTADLAADSGLSFPHRDRDAGR